MLNQQRACATSPPDILVIHLCEYNLGYAKERHWCVRCEDLKVVIQMFPGTTVVFSDIAQRRSWMFQWDQKINKYIEGARALRQSACVYISGNTIRHPAFKQCVPRM